MNTAQNAENRMVINNFETEAPERSSKQIRESFKEWLEGQELDAHYFEMFLEDWFSSELLSFSEEGRMQEEFKQWQANRLQYEFEEQCGENISTLEIMQEITE